jgi:toxin ParE1/3/4
MTRRGGVRRGGIWQFVAFVRAIVWRSVASIAGRPAMVCRFQVKASTSRQSPSGRNNSAAAARGVVLHIMHNIEQLLSDNPQMGRPGRVPGTRELVIPRTPFIVPYRLQRNIIQILRVYHGARR